MFSSRFLHAHQGIRATTCCSWSVDISQVFYSHMYFLLSIEIFQACELPVPASMVVLGAIAIKHAPKPLIYDYFCHYIYTLQESKQRAADSGVNFKAGGVFDFCG